MGKAVFVLLKDPRQWQMANGKSSFVFAETPANGKWQMGKAVLVLLQTPANVWVATVHFEILRTIQGFFTPHYQRFICGRVNERCATQSA